MKKVLVILVSSLILLILSCGHHEKTASVIQSDTLDIYYNEETDWVCDEATIMYEECKMERYVYMSYKGNTYVSLNGSVSIEFWIASPERKKVVLQSSDSGHYIVNVLY